MREVANFFLSQHPNVTIALIQPVMSNKEAGVLPYPESEV